MRHFGKDAPEFMAFTVGDDDTVYKMPLPSSLPFDASIRFAECASMPDGEGAVAAMRLQLDLLRDAMGDKADRLTSGQVAEIFEAWSEDQAETGATTGESGA